MAASETVSLSSRELAIKKLAEYNALFENKEITPERAMFLFTRLMATDGEFRAALEDEVLSLENEISNSMFEAGVYNYNEE